MQIERGSAQMPVWNRRPVEPADRGAVGLDVGATCEVRRVSLQVESRLAVQGTDLRRIRRVVKQPLEVLARCQEPLPPAAGSMYGRPNSTKSIVVKPPLNSTSNWPCSCVSWSCA